MCNYAEESSVSIVIVLFRYLVGAQLLEHMRLHLCNLFDSE